MVNKGVLAKAIEESVKIVDDYYVEATCSHCNQTMKSMKQKSKKKAKIMEKGLKSELMLFVCSIFKDTKFRNPKDKHCLTLNFVAKTRPISDFEMLKKGKE